MERAGGGSLEGETEQEKRDGEQQELLEGGVEAAGRGRGGGSRALALNQAALLSFASQALLASGGYGKTGVRPCCRISGSSWRPPPSGACPVVPLVHGRANYGSSSSKRGAGERGGGSETGRRREDEQEEGGGGGAGAGRGGAIWLDFFPLENWRGTGKGGWMPLSRVPLPDSPLMYRPALYRASAGCW